MQNSDLINDNDTIDSQTTNSGRSRNKGLRRIAFLAGGLGLSAAIGYLVSKVLGRSATGPEHIVDDRGTGQKKAARILRNLRDQAFEASDEKLALALGRPLSEVTAWNAGSEIIDDDVMMKARGIAMHRGVYVE